MKLSSYDIDINKLVGQYIRPHLRGVIRVQWVASLLKHFKTIHAEFLLHFNAIENEMKWDGRTILLERLLQLKFNIPTLQIINNDLSKNPLFGYLCPDPLNHFGYEPNSTESPIGYEPDTILESYGFVIQVPNGSQYDSAEMRATVNRYLIGGSDFEIIEI